jgi:outer membrane protein OmpA-like peptidoglycan-associated protein/ABC-type taurine transport system substrate-binding protein
MNRRVIGAIFLLIIGLLGIAGYWYLAPKLQDRQQKSTSDAKNTQGTISLALDNWVGYFILKSPEMKQNLRRQGWLLKVEDDNADLPKRMKKLADGEVDFAVATIDSYILNAAKLSFPGTIIAVIDESKGGDAILGRKEKVENLDKIKSVPNLRIAFTPDSPSHFLAKAAAYHFNVPELLPKGSTRIETKGSEEALKKLLAGKADVAIMWEPDVSRALRNKEIVKLLGTEDTERLIVDVLIVSRKFSKENPALVKMFLATYFKTLKSYVDDPPMLTKHLVQETALQETDVTSMLKGVKWVNLTENCEKWFGISSPGIKGDDDLITTIESTVGVLKNAGDFTSSPLPSGDPYRIMYSTYLEELFLKGTSGFASKKPGEKEPENSLESKFSPLNNDQWDRLKQIGTLKIDPITFQHSGVQLDLLQKQTLDKSIELLKHYPHFRVIIKGHTDTRGDPDKNIEVSQERADTVAKYLQVTYNIDLNRLHAIGLGGSQPLPEPRTKAAAEMREWHYRLPRVELVLVREEI